MARDVQHHGRHTHLIVEYPWGWYRGGRVMCSDGKVRSLKRIADTADTFFSVPAAVNVGKRTVSGYVTIDEVNGESVVLFIAYEYRKNHDVLPEGSWLRYLPTPCETCGHPNRDEAHVTSTDTWETCEG